MTKIRLSLVFILFVSCSCGSSDSFKNISPDEYVYSQPIDLLDGVKTGDLVSQGFDTEKTSEIARDVLEDYFREVNGVLIYRNDYLVFEEYFNGFNQDTKNDIRSATKSITGLLVGIAIDKGFLSGVDQRVFELFSQYEDFDNWDPAKEEITVAHLLTMSSGLACDYDKVTSSGEQVLVYDVDDWVKLFLDAPVRANPGEVFAYCSAGIVALGEIIRIVSGMTVEEFSQKYLFSPLGISNYRWELTGAGQVDTAGHIRFTARDMLKIGKLFLQNGKWDEKQIVSGEWIAQMREPAFDDYGYTWWRSGSTGEGDFYLIYHASGNGGNRIFVVPRHELVVVVSASNYNSSYGAASEYILYSLILPQLDL